MPSTMSTSTTSASPASAMRWAVVAPTLPAPMTVTLLRAMAWVRLRFDERGPARRRWWDAARAAASLALDDGIRVDEGGAGVPDPLADAIRVRGEVLVEHGRQAPGGL